MSKIIDFNSLWEIAFAINAIFVYFELTPVLKRKFKSINAIGRNVIDEMIEKQDRRYINTYGWKSFLFGYTIWVLRLKVMSIFNSLLAIFLIIFAGFKPESVIGSFYLVIIILILFTPILIVIAIFRYGFPFYKLKCIEEAIQNILDRDIEDSTILINKKRRYKIVIEYIKLTEIGPSFFIKRNKEFSTSEIFQEAREIKK